MTDAREIVARAREESRDKSDLGVLLYQAIAWPSEACGTALMDENLHDWQVRAAISALTAAGFRIVGPDDVAQLERIAKGDIPGVWQEKFEKAQKIARAIGRKA